MPKNKDVEAFLQGLGLILLTNGVPERKSKIRGNFGKGISCAIKYALGVHKDIDVNLIKLNKTESAPQMVLGDSWGSKYITEKRILDSIINAIKKSTYNWLHLTTWLQPFTEVTKRFGLDIKTVINNPILEESERAWIRNDFKLSELPESKGDEKKGLIFTDLKIVDLKVESIGDMQAYTKMIHDRVKELKPVKDFVNDIVSQRVKLAYNHQLNKSMKKRSKGIEPLINNIRRTREYLVSFNIGRSAKMPRPFVPPTFPVEERETRIFLQQLSEWERSYSSEQIYSDRAKQIANWYQSAIAE